MDLSWQKLVYTCLISYLLLDITYTLPNYNNFFSDKEIAKDIVKRIEIFKRGSDKDIEIISPRFSVCHPINIPNNNNSCSAKIV